MAVSKNDCLGRRSSLPDLLLQLLQDRILQSITQIQGTPSTALRPSCHSNSVRVCQEGCFVDCSLGWKSYNCVYTVVNHQLLNRKASTVEKHQNDLCAGSDGANHCINEGELPIWQPEAEPKQNCHLLVSAHMILNLDKHSVQTLIRTRWTFDRVPPPQYHHCSQPAELGRRRRRFSAVHRVQVP